MSRDAKLKAIALIGIRSGSQGLKDKNIKYFCGKPLVYWIIKTALNASNIDRVFVSTDSEKYRDIAIDTGAEAPFLRPKSISGDNSKEKDYILHCLEWLQVNENYQPDIVSRLQATSPLQLPEDIDRSIQSLEDDPYATSSMVVSKAIQHPMKAMKMDGDNKYLIPYCLEDASLEIVNRQTLPVAYFRSNIISSRCSYLLETKKQIGERSLIIEIPSERSIDINNSLDFFIAEKVAEKLGICSFN